MSRIFRIDHRPEATTTATFFPKFRRWPRSLSPRKELIVRDPDASREWEARIAELQAGLIKGEDDWAELLPAVGRAKAEIGSGTQKAAASKKRTPARR